jgi:Carboxypeptidase regulatory-like domain/TonB dependent receptor-like, beta-barrel/TonB-dependent Receptor Plug Domain
MPRPSKLALHLLRSLLLLTLLASAIHAQLVATGRVNGIVIDQAGAVLPGARVRVIELQTNQVRSIISNQSGEFSFPILPVGEYRVETELAGFKKNITNNVKLTVDQTINLELALQVGEVSQTIEVTGSPTLVESSVPTLKNVIDQKKIQELPLEGRNVLKLMLLVPGVQPTSGAFLNQEYTAPNQVFVSSNGGRGNTIVYNLDGVDNSDTYTNVANSYPNPDALEAITIETNSYSAEHGRRGGGVLNAITRGGTNRWHGSLFEFVRNSAFNATNFFTPGIEDGLKRHQFGGTVGGPIFKDKTFFFSSYQRTTFRRISLDQTAVVPTAEQRRGDFSNLRGGNGQVITIIDPATGLPFLNNQIPAGRISPIATKLLDLLPVPDNPAGLVRLSIPNSSDDDQFLARVDHNISNSNRLTGRLLYDRLKSGTGLSSNNILNAVTRANFRTTNISISDTHTFSPTLIGVFSATLNRLWSGKGGNYPTTLSELGAEIVDLDPNKDIWLLVNGFFNINSLGSVILVRNNYQYQGSFTYVKGDHEMKFGADTIRQQFNLPAASLASNGLNIFGNAYSGSNLSDFMLGRPSLFIQITPWGEALRAWQPGAYFQDNYKLTPRLTINAGLRFDPYLPWKEHQANKILAFKPGLQSQISPGLPRGIVVAGEYGVPEAGHNGSWTKFAPRLGIAYLLPNEKTSVRAGYGIFFDYPNAIINNRHASNIPFVLRVDVANPTSLENPWTVAQPNPFPAPIPVPSGFQFPLPAIAVTYSDDFTNGYMQQWNLTAEHQLTSNWLARVSYIGSRGVKLMSVQEINPARFIPGQSTLQNVNARRIYAPDFASIQSLTTDDTSNYQAIAFSAERRFRNDYTVSASYTFGKAKDYQSNVVAHGQPSFTNPFDRSYDYAAADFDRRHRFVGSFLWQLPVLKNSSTPVRLVGGGWQLNSIVTVQSGTPFTVFAGLDTSLDGVGSDRPDLVGNPALDTGRPRGELIARYFNTAAFHTNAFGTYGTAARNLLRGPGLATFDFSVLKNFNTPWFNSEGANLQLRVEAFNIFNRANFANPNGTLTSSLFGRITSAGEPRILQFGIRFVF